MRFSLLFNGQNKYIFFSFSKYICSFFLIAFLLSILLVLSLAGQLCLPGHPLIGADAKNARNSGQPLVDSTSCRQSTKDPPWIQNNIIQQWMLGAETGMQTIKNVHFTAWSPINNLAIFKRLHWPLWPKWTDLNASHQAKGWSSIESGKVWRPVKNGRESRWRINCSKEVV